MNGIQGRTIRTRDPLKNNSGKWLILSVFLILIQSVLFLLAQPGWCRGNLSRTHRVAAIYSAHRKFKKTHVSRKRAVTARVMNRDENVVPETPANTGEGDPGTAENGSGPEEQEKEPGGEQIGPEQGGNESVAEGNGSESGETEPLPPVLDLDLHPGKITTQIHSNPRKSEIDSPLQLKVKAGHPGWRLHIQASALTFDTHKIEPEEMVVSGPSGKCRLSGSFPLVGHGPKGETDLDLNVSLDTKKLHVPGTYKGRLKLVLRDDTCAITRCKIIPVTVKVICEVEHRITGNKIYFHVGNPLKLEKLKAVVKGSLKADAPMLLRLLSTSDCIEKLSMVQDFIKSRKTEAEIPVVWKLKEGNGDFRRPDVSDSEGVEIGWHLKKTPGVMNYRLECTIKPEKYQAPGEYGSSAVIVLTPIL